MQEAIDGDSTYMRYVDVVDAFLTHEPNADGQQELVPSMMSADTVNLSLYGIRTLAQRLEPVVTELVKVAKRG